MQRIHNVSGWTQLKPGEAFKYTRTRPRRVRIETNSPGEARLYLVDDYGQIVFLARVLGRDTIEFDVVGAFSLMADAEGSEVFIQTMDGDTIHSVIEAPVSFARIMERRPRNLELERITAEMAYNMNRRLDQMARESERLFEARLQALAAQSPAAPVSGGAGSEPAPAGNGAASAA